MLNWSLAEEPSVGEGLDPPANVKQLSRKNVAKRSVFGKTNSSISLVGRAGHDPPLQWRVRNRNAKLQFSVAVRYRVTPDGV